MSWAETKKNAFELKKNPFTDFLNKLLFMGVIGENDWDRERGNHFNIPKCCIEWFVYLGNAGMADRGACMAKIYGHDLNCDYVRCVSCRMIHP